MKNWHQNPTSIFIFLQLYFLSPKKNNQIKKNNQAESWPWPAAATWCSFPGTFDGDSAKNTSNDIINTGTNRSSTGGGGNGGSTRGNNKRDTAKTINIATDLKLKNAVTIKYPRRRQLRHCHRKLNFDVTQLNINLLVHIVVKSSTFNL